MRLEDGDATVDVRLTRREPVDLDFIRIASKSADIILDPTQREPLILEAKVSGHVWSGAGKKSESRDAVANVNPKLVSLRSDVLRLAAEAVRRTKL